MNEKKLFILLVYSLLRIFFSETLYAMHNFEAHVRRMMENPQAVFQVVIERMPTPLSILTSLLSIIPFFLMTVIRNSSLCLFCFI